MRFLGVDYGASRIGLALSDDGGSLAFPYAVYLNDKEFIEKIKTIYEKEGFDAVVIGESKNFQQIENTIMKEIRLFSDTIFKKNFDVPVYFEPEFLTTAEAKHYEKPGMRDASAAAIILQSYLDKQKISR